MIMKTMAAFFTVLVLSNISLTQNAPPTFYAESFRKGPTRITTEKTEIKLTSEDPVYKRRIRDSLGAEKYELEIIPQIAEAEGNNKITSWQVSLRDLRHNIYGNLLQFDRELSEDPKDNIYWLNPVQSAPVPIRAKRVIKVDSFYVVFQVTNFRFSPADSPYLESMMLQFELSNSDPRANTP